jgi:hypothetical protein
VENKKSGVVEFGLSECIGGLVYLLGGGKEDFDCVIVL